MKKVLCMILLVLTVMMTIAAKTESCTLTLRAVVEEKNTFTMTDDGFCSFSSNAAEASSALRLSTPSDPRSESRTDALPQRAETSLSSLPQNNHLRK